MKRITTNLLRLALSAGLTQRELFVERVAALLTEKMETDPEQSTHLANSLMNLTEALKDELMFREMMTRMTNATTNETTDERTQAAADGAASASRAASEDTARCESELSAKIDALNRTITELNALLKTQ